MMIRVRNTDEWIGGTFKLISSRTTFQGKATKCLLIEAA